MEKSGSFIAERLKTNYERINKMINPDKETMVSFLVSNQILATIDDISYVEGQASRSSIFRKLVKSGLKNYYEYLENNKLVKQQ